MNNLRFNLSGLLSFLLLVCAMPIMAQQRPSMYGDKVKADVKLNYVYTLEEALRQAKVQKKPIFFNCFADWAVPCHGMNIHVFSDRQFADYMNKTFVNLFIDVSQREAAPIVQRYAINTFAHYLILDANGDILMRIVGGKKLPEFKEDVMRALNPKTSLAGTERTYNSGKFTKKDLSHYLYALHLANEGKRFAQVGTQYLGMMQPSEYAKKENWFVFSKLVTDYDSNLYAHLIAHKEDFIKANGERAVNQLIEGLYYPVLADFASGTTPYDSEKLMTLFLNMQKANLPDTALSYTLYDMAKMRGERRYEALIAYMQQNGHKLGTQRGAFEMTFDFPEMTESQRAAVIAYLRQAATADSTGGGKHLSALADRMASNEGVKFETSSFNEALSKAKREGKLLFLDCYTTWCGPCKMMTRDIFPQPEVGRVFNERFVSIKIDMEKGEGIELAKRYEVKAYPTMLLIDGEGKVVKTILGALQAPQLIEAVTTIP